MEYRLPKAGECYRHFKGERYQVLTIAKHTETGEDMVVYEALYGEHPVYVRPLALFVSKVDKQKFPNITQEYRFELEEETAAADEGEQSQIGQFLDLKSNEEKVRFLQQIRPDITEDFLSAIAQGMEFAETKTDVEERYQDILKYLRTLIKYEGGRLH